MLLNINSPLLMNILMVVLMSAIMIPMTNLFFGSLPSELIRDLFHSQRMILHGSRLTSDLIALVICTIVILTCGILIIKMVTLRIVTRRTITSEILINEILTSGVLTSVTLTSLLRNSRAHGNKIRHRSSHVNNKFLFKSPRDSNNNSNNNNLHRSSHANNHLPKRLSVNRSRFIAHLQLRMQKKKMMMTTFLPGLRLEQSPHVLLNLIVKRLSNNNNNSGHKGNKGNNNDSGLSRNSNVVPFRPSSSRRMKTWRNPPSNVVPRHKAGVLIKPAVSPPRTLRLMKMKTHSSKNFGVIVKERLSVLVRKRLSIFVTMNFYVLIEKNFGVLPKKSIRVLVALLLNIVASTMSLTVPISVMDMKIIIHPIDTLLAPDLIL